jgi:hypothetical protein
MRKTRSAATIHPARELRDSRLRVAIAIASQEAAEHLANRRCPSIQADKQEKARCESQLQDGYLAKNGTQRIDHRFNYYWNSVRN